MTSKLAQRCTTCMAVVAIVALIGLIAYVWIQFGQGPAKTAKKQGVANATVQELEYGAPAAKGRPKNKEFIEKTYLDKENKDTEFIKPLKVGPPPLHGHDIIYDQLHNKNNDNNKDEVQIRHHSGHFRHRLAEVWDPHPKYEINVFGKKLVLELTVDNSFVSTDLWITTHVYENYTERERHDPKMAACYYTGKVQGDPDSLVVVSLCGGMTGYIRTGTEVYHIDPAETFTNETIGSTLHRIQRVRQTSPKSNNNVISSSTENCDTSGSIETHTIVSDDFGGIATETAPPRHVINKRDVIFDDLNTEHIIQNMESMTAFHSHSDRIFNYQNYEQDELFRTTRDADWGKNYAKRSNENFVKVMVVVEKSMAEYHRNEEELKHYVMTLMAHVALLFKDASIGNAITISVVDIWILKHKDFSSTSSQGMLQKFCKWQQTEIHKRNHNVAVLLTRNVICKNPNQGDCQTLGVAEVGSMCSSSYSCAIAADKGLSTSYTIAHELGHVLSMPHDNDTVCEEFNRRERQQYIMSQMMMNDTKPWMWSECSRHFVTKFLETSKAKCLLNPPTNVLVPDDEDLLPGEKFDYDKQCELEFGKGMKLCTYMSFCRHLWCMKSDIDGEKQGCKTEYLPWGEGSSCGHNKWCYQGECRSQDRGVLVPRDGNWGPWQGWGPCSRTCGGGIKISQRLCDSPPPTNGGNYCTGKRVKYMSCNTQNCDSKEPDFRALQCARFNGITKNLPNLTRDVEWLPKFGLNKADEVCKLYCRPKNSNAYYMLRDKVEDGTKCGLTSFDICVNGLCRPAGCDNKLDSKIMLDNCGVCGGNNSKCEEISGSYNIVHLGYNRVVRIPKGSYNIEIRQRSGPDEDIDHNYLALVDGESGEYILNGAYMVSSYQKDVIFGGLIFEYSGSNVSVEKIASPKSHRLSKDLVVEVLSVGKVKPPDISYRYFINQDNAPRYGWRLYQKQWSKCNSICSGTQYMRPVCIELAHDTPVDDNYCADLDIHGVMQKRECNLHCQLTWNVVSKGQCSSQCGPGYRDIFYNCMKIGNNKEANDAYNHESMNNHNAIVNDRHCSILPKPPHKESCEGPCESTRWEFGKFSECSKTCGGGVQTRSAKCVSANGREVDESQCNPSQKITQQRCNNGHCPYWSPSDEWSSCSVSCGRGFKQRRFYCLVDNRIYADSDCDPSTMPVVKEACEMRSCHVNWVTQPWTECSVSCGEGIQSRNVYCKQEDKAVDDEYCREMLKPNNTKICRMDDCKLYPPYDEYDFDNSIQSFTWRTGPWTPCSASCNRGYQKRTVVCKNHLGDRQDYCDPNTRPKDVTECNDHPCPKWNFGAWSECDSNCEQQRQVSCQDYKGNFVNDDECDKPHKPIDSQKCHPSQCHRSNEISRRAKTQQKEHPTSSRYKWKVGKWKQCSTQCGKGVRRRQVECEDVSRRVRLVDSYCSRERRRPKATQSCERYNCSVAWLEGYWSSCSRTCDEGIKTRNVTCHRILPDEIVSPDPLPDPRHNREVREYCSLYNKPSTTASCLVSRCSDEYYWSPGPWSACSHNCGTKGKQERKLYCKSRRSDRTVARKYCPKNLKPPRKRKCNRRACVYNNCKEVKLYKNTKENKDYTIFIRNKMAKVYCYKMDTPEPEEFITLNPSMENYAEVYDRRLLELSTCPYNGDRRDDCQCDKIGPDRSGLTTFWKVRVNITSLKILGDDFTFSHSRTPMKIPFGTAGDCYSSYQGCPQGRFSIDLSGTWFRLSQTVRWINIGSSATSQIHFNRDRSIVMGKCGGYCGNCIPDPQLGLEVEVT